jgi:DNA-nicking Smr family endonuclease
MHSVIKTNQEIRQMKSGVSSAFQEIDVHNMTRVQAITAIDAKLRKADSSVYQLRVIHGFHSGTVLRDAVRAHYRNHPKVKRVELGLNQGETTFILREL